MNIRETVKFTSARINAAHARRPNVEQKKAQSEKRIEEAVSLFKLANSSKLYLERAVDVVYRSQIGDLEERINQALRFVFDDREFRIKLEIDDARGNKAVRFLLEDSTTGAPLLTDLKDGQGGGVRTVVSILIHVYYLIQKKLEPILFIDEGYAYVAEEYEDNFFEFIKGLCHAQKFKLVIISHDRRFAEACDAEYRMDMGRLSRVK